MGQWSSDAQSPLTGHNGAHPSEIQLSNVDARTSVKAVHSAQAVSNGGGNHAAGSDVASRNDHVDEQADVGADDAELAHAMMSEWGGEMLADRKSVVRERV